MTDNNYNNSEREKVEESPKTFDVSSIRMAYFKVESIDWDSLMDNCHPDHRDIGDIFPSCKLDCDLSFLTEALESEGN